MNFHSCLSKLYAYHSSLTHIGGIWKSGKTDFALLLAELLLKFKYVNKVASNIRTSDNRIEYVSSYEELRFWLHTDRMNKLYILDEAGKYVLKRTPMGKMNVEMIRLLAEVSKGRGRIIIVAQETLSLDNEFLNPTWCQGLWVKKNLKTVSLFSHLIGEELIFSDIPKTTIDFDPYDIAPFTFQPLDRACSLFEDDDLSKLWRFSNGATYRQLGIHAMQLNRLVRKFIRETLEPRARNLVK